MHPPTSSPSLDLKLVALRKVLFAPEMSTDEKERARHGAVAELLSELAQRQSALTARIADLERQVFNLSQRMLDSQQQAAEILRTEADRLHDKARQIQGRRKVL